MVLPDCCTCSFWCLAFFRKCCCCCPPECEYRCSRCLTGCSRFIYCFHKVCVCVLDIPRRFIASILHWLCCAACFAFLVLMLLTMLLVFLFRMFCPEIINILNQIFAPPSPFPLPFFLTQHLVTSGISTWNNMVPYISFGLSLAVDLEMTIYENIVATVGESGLDLLMEDMMENAYWLSQIVLGVIMGVCESSPASLQGIAQQSTQITVELTQSHEVLLPTLQWVTGSLFDVMIPLLTSVSGLLVASSTVVVGTGRTLLEFQAPINEGYRPRGSSGHYTGFEDATHANDMAASYIHELQTAFQLMRTERDLDSIIKNAKDISDARAKLQKQYRNSGNVFATKDPPPQGLSEEQVASRKLRIRAASEVVRHHASKTLSAFTNSDLFNTYQPKPSLMSPIQWLGFRDLKHMNQHLREEYQDGKGFVASFKPNEHPIFKQMESAGVKAGYYMREMSFSEYMRENGLVPKNFSREGIKEMERRGHEEGFNTGRKLLQIFFPTSPLLDCVLSVPPDPLCILIELIPPIAVTPDFIEPLLDFSCDCSEYNEEFYYTLDGLSNALTVLRTLASLISSISIFADALSAIGMLPPIVEDNLFLVPPGEAVESDDILCALTYLDYFLAYFIPLIIIIPALISTLGFIWTCFKVFVELSILNEHQRLVDEVLGTQELGRAYDSLFEQQGEDSFFNPWYYCYGVKSPFHKPTYWHGDDNKALPVILDSINNIRVRKNCFESHASTDAQDNHISDETAQRLLGPYRNEIPDAFQPRHSSLNLRLIASCDEPNQSQPQSQHIGDDIESSAEPIPPYHPALRSSATTHIQQQLVHRAVKNVRPHATKKEVRDVYHMMYPEDHSEVGKGGLTGELKREFGDLSEVMLTSDELRECHEVEQRPYLHHEHTQKFQRDIQRREEEEGGGSPTIHQHYHINDSTSGVEL